MANTILRLKHHRKSFHTLSLFSTLLLVMQRVGAFEFKVGDANGWTVPTDPSVNTYNQWAETKRFQIGDSLLFDYSADKDSVVQVKKEDYDSCNSTSPIKSYTGGHNSITFNKNGPYYFISGVQENCQKNEKMVIVVMADRSNRSSTTNQTTSASPPSPSGYIENAPAPSPVTEIAPSTPSVESPTSPTPSGASSMFVSAIASIAAFVVSSMLLVL
ncbi:early nodulin-like protein 3 [Telopea speciosissima]|uniref:early nodulin-like protein 3 n=1 Tax=Telopea speciosissima TaxID=54955 RepID=UPI001CC44610|nr:early nodulin-like protein 3 [Telopea speciosissima]XP_043692265.1 early nodulin-like protein 3 [Telopea speciosissima]